MATLKGPSFSGFRSGWTSASLTPMAMTTAAQPTSNVSVSWSQDSPLTAAEKKAYEDDLNARLNSARASGNLLSSPPLGPVQATAAAQPATAADPFFVPPSGQVVGTPQTQQSSGITPEGLYYGIAAASGGPSFSGPKLGWTPSTPGPQATSFSTLAPPAGAIISNTPTTDLSKYDLTPQELGMGAGRNAYGGGRGTFTVPTPLEALLASIFPDAASGPEAAPLNPNTQAPQGGERLRTIFANLGLDMGGGGGGSSVGFASPAMAAPSIPGAPAFLPGAVSNVQNAGIPLPGGGGGANVGNALAGVSAIAAEQRIQQAEMEKAKAQAQADWFKSQQKIQQQAAKRQQIQRQKMGSASGWASTPTFY